MSRSYSNERLSHHRQRTTKATLDPRRSSNDRTHQWPCSSGICCGWATPRRLVEGGVTNSYDYPSDPVNRFDLSGESECWSVLGTVAVVALAGIGAAACIASVVCGVGGLILIGVGAGVASYAASNAFTPDWNSGEMAASGLAGGAGGAVGDSPARPHRRLRLLPWRQ